MTPEKLDEMISDMTRQHQKRIDQLTNLFGSAGGPEIFELAEKVMGPGINAADWLTSGQIGLNGAVPAVVALDSDGHERVKTYLIQIEYGVYV